MVLSSRRVTVINRRGHLKRADKWNVILLYVSYIKRAHLFTVTLCNNNKKLMRAYHSATVCRDLLWLKEWLITHAYLIAPGITWKVSELEMRTENLLRTTFYVLGQSYCGNSQGTGPKLTESWDYQKHVTAMTDSHLTHLEESRARWT